MDPFELLKKDHETVSNLFERIESASGKAKLEVFRQIKSELDLHTHIEEAIFYPALEKANQTRDLTLEAYEEHKVVKNLLSELDTAKSVSDEWDAKLKVLKENVEHHVDEEENELFDKANNVLTGEEAERLGDRMRAEKVKRGASAPDATAEEPGLLRKIANTLGLGATKKGPGKKKPAKAKAAKKSGRASAKASSKASKASNVSAKKGKTSAARPAGSKKSRAAASKKAAKKKSVGEKRKAAKKTGRGR